jgi:hypothetical protein
MVGFRDLAIKSLLQYPALDACYKPKRVAFVSDMLQKCDEELEFLNSILFSDEATFHINGSVNRHNCQIWGSENPHIVKEHVQDIPKVNICCGLMRNRISDHFSSPNKQSLAMSMSMLENYVFPQIDDMENDDEFCNVFLQDEAPLHFSNNVCKALNARFPDQWNKRNRPIAWPPRSPDLMPLNFFLWGHVKNTVYRENIGDKAQFKESITRATISVTPKIPDRVWTEIECRYDVCHAVNGSHIEVV